MTNMIMNAIQCAKFISLPVNCMKYLGLMILVNIFISCKDFVEVDPPETSLVGETVFEDDINATTAMVGIYARMVESPSTLLTGSANFTIISGLSSDELVNYSSDIEVLAFEENSLTDDNGDLLGRWTNLYNFIYSCNSVLDGLQNATNVTDSISIQFEGEAKFVRAWMYFYLVNFWNDVPLVLTTDYEENALLPRVSSSIVYDQIIADLQDAGELLPETYSSDLRIRPVKSAANALLARIYLYLQDWVNAESLATSVIENGRYKLEDNLDNVFLNTSQEAIWQLQSINPDVGTYDALRFILVRAPRGFGFSLRPEFMDIFEEGDNRETSWVGELNSGSSTFYYPFKFKTRFLDDGERSNEYLTVLRLAEIYLIRAEARVQQGNISGALEDLNIVRLRSGLTKSTASDFASLLLAIEQERKVELFAELGHRWFDLRRYGRATEVLSPIKPEWQDTDVFYPVPIQEFLNNPNLGEQNPGY